MEKKEIELESKGAVLYLPINSIFLSITCKIVDDSGNVQEVHRTMTNKDIQEAFNDYDENYFDDDSKFALTEEGKKFAEEIIKRNEI